MSQPCNLHCNLEQPGAVDADLGEFWEGDPFKIFEKHNLSAFERNRMYLNVGDRNFVDVSFVSGADSDGDGRGSFAADFNQDGQLDLAVRQVGGGPLLIYENQSVPQHYLKVTLRGSPSNRLGIGARLVAQVGQQQIVRERYPVNSYLSQSPLVVHFGLGPAQAVDQLVVKWPSGTEQTLRALPADRHVVITEGNDQVEFAEPGKVCPP